MEQSHFYIIAKRVDESHCPFVIIEKMETVDGLRDRITNRAFKTLEEAKDFIKTIERNG